MSSFLGMEIEDSNGNLMIHLDTYIQETLAEYKTTVSKFLKPKQVPMQPENKLEIEDCPKIPDLVRQKMYRSFVAELHFAASWVCCDIGFTASQLAWFCASAGPLHWAALHHAMGYLEENPSFMLSYQRGGSDGLDGFAYSDWGNSITRRSTTELLSRFKWSSGDPRCRRLSRYRPPKRNTTRRRRWL